MDFSAKEMGMKKLGELTALTAYKRTPALDNSTWYKGILVSQMAGMSDSCSFLSLTKSINLHLSLLADFLLP